MEYQNLMKEIEQGKLVPIYFFFGEEIYLVEQLIKAIVEKGTEQATRDFNCDILNAENTDGKTVAGIASSFPLTTDRRVVVVKNVQRFSPSDRKLLLMYIQSPLKSTSLVLTAGKVDRRQSFYVSLVKHSSWVECKRLYENQAVDWVKHRLKEKGVVISQEGALFLVQQLGTSLWNLTNEVEKLLTFSWGKDELGLDDVTGVVGLSRQFNTWELTDAVADKDLKNALTIMNRLLEEGQSPVGLIVNLSQRIFLLTQIRAMLDRGMSRDEIIRSLNLNFYFGKLYVNQAMKFTGRELESAVAILRKADFYIKTGRMDPDMVMTMVIYDLARDKSKGKFYNANLKISGTF